MAKANQASPNRQYEKKSLTKLNSYFKTIRIKHNPQTSDDSLQKIFYTSRRLRKDLGPIKGKPYIDLSYNQMIAALMMPKYWNRLEVQSSVEFLLASILFVIGSIGELQQQLPFKGLFMAGSIMFLLGGLTQLWQTIRAWLRYQNHILVNFSLGLIGVVTAKAGTICFNVDSTSTWLNLNLLAEAKLLLGRDAYLAGSILLLISGIAHYAEIGHGRLLFFERHHLAWWGCTSFLVGSLLYCLSALHGFAITKIWIFNFYSERDSIILCLSASIAFTLMSLLSLAECSENDVKNNNLAAIGK